MPTASQRKKDSSKYFNMSADLFALFLAFMAFSGLSRRPLWNMRAKRTRGHITTCVDDILFLQL